MNSTRYELPEKLVASPQLTHLLVKAEDAVARLDERARTSPLRDGWQARLLYGEACACQLAGGDLVHLEDLVLLDGGAYQGPSDMALSAAYGKLSTWRKAVRGDAIRLLAGPCPGEDVSEQRSPHKDGHGGRDQVPEYFYDPDWDGTERLAVWRRVADAARRAFPPLLAAAIAWDAWLSINPEERGDWRAGLIAALTLKAMGKTRHMLLPVDTGWRFSKCRRMPNHAMITRVSGFLDWVCIATERAGKDLDRLVMAEGLLRAKLTGRRKSSRLPALVDLLLSRPLVSVPIAAKALRCSNQAVEGMLRQLGSVPRELTGRQRYRVWGIV